VLTLVIEARAAEQPLAASTIIVYNKAALDSAELARFYAQRRGIASDHIVGLTCSTDEEITREEFDSNIAGPLREIFKTRNWWTMHETAEQRTVLTATSIRFVAVIKGVPLKIKPTSGPYPGDQPASGPVSDHNEASVDSELAVLGSFSRQISGPMRNPYFQSFKPIGELDNPVLLLVCRLDAPNAETVRRMIVDSIATEKKGLWGRAYVDGMHETAAGYAIGEQWLAEIPVQLRKVGVPVVYDNSPAIFPDGYPMTDCALYYGWRTEKAAGPFAQSEFRFLPGAVAVHIHSFTAMTLRDPNANWVGPLLAKGAAASMGNVYEPYLQLTPHLDIFNDRLLHGFTFAESAYMSVRVLSWMSVMVGDPLYRPYASWLQIEVPSASAKRGTDWKIYHEFAVKNITRPAAEFRDLTWQTATSSHNCSMMEDVARMEEREGSLAAATSHLERARTCYRNGDDVLRVTLAEADAWTKQNDPKKALELVRDALQNAPDAPAASLLRKMEEDLKKPAPTPKP